MKTFASVFLCSILVPCLGLLTGCAGLPNVHKIINETPDGQGKVRIASSKGLLTPEESEAIMDRLRSSAAPTDILGRYTAVVDAVTGSPLTTGNKVTLLANGLTAYAEMFRAIQNAKDHINFETFIIDDDEVGRKFSDLLLKKQAEGVQVNLIFDAVGSFDTPAAFFKRLRDAGIRVAEFNPVSPLKVHKHWLLHPDHRKILVIDGKVVITGGINISKVYSSRLSDRKEVKGEPLPWRDTDVRIEGPAVAEFQKLFLDTWKKQAGAQLADRDYFPALTEPGDALVRVVGSTPGQSNRLTFIVYVSAITFAQRSVHLTNAYFIPDDQLLDALTGAAGRGVDVKVIVPSQTDSEKALRAQRYTYSELLKAGVKVYERRKAVLHAKTAVIDGVWSTVGSTNMDFWSFSSDDEVNAVILSTGFAAEMEAMFSSDLAESDQITLKKWKKRSLYTRLRQWFSHLFSHWL